MKYFKKKNKSAAYTVITPVELYAKRIIYYHQDNDYAYIGVETDDVNNFINSQPSELEMIELTFDEIKEILDNSRLMREFDNIIEDEIAKKYSIGRELKMRDLPPDDPERLQYEAYKESIKEKVRLLKIEAGLKQG
ncbi:hypothetical protein ACSSWA_01260 [Melioribacter sp. Ez-97]|uniref:hypothetical protein n=1 Tax=Melioribacter sp. Ez-97 TaxID=3423434 RepID=UPI003EDA1402